MVPIPLEDLNQKGLTLNQYPELAKNAFKFLDAQFEKGYAYTPNEYLKGLESIKGKLQSEHCGQSLPPNLLDTIIFVESMRVLRLESSDVGPVYVRRDCVDLPKECEALRALCEDQERRIIELEKGFTKVLDEMEEIAYTANLADLRATFPSR